MHLGPMPCRRPRWSHRILLHPSCFVACSKLRNSFPLLWGGSPGCRDTGTYCRQWPSLGPSGFLPGTSSGTSRARGSTGESTERSAPAAAPLLHHHNPPCPPSPALRWLFALFFFFFLLFQQSSDGEVCITVDRLPSTKIHRSISPSPAPHLPDPAPAPSQQGLWPGHPGSRG